MKVKIIAAVVLISLVFLSITVLTSAAQSQSPLNESRPELMIIDPRERQPYFDDGVDPLQPEPSSPEIIPWSKLVFQSYRTLDWEIFTGNDDGTGQQQLTNIPANDLYPRFNRGATRVVFASEREVGTGDYDLYIMNPDGSNVTQLTFTTGDDWNPVYSPDGTKIAFQSVVNNQSDIFVINTNGTGLVNLTNHPDYDGAPSWSPDGTKLAFVSRRTGGYRIYSMNANGTNVTQLSTQPYSNNPAWSPDGQRIAYDADTDGSSRVFPEIYLMNADGSGQTMLYRPSGPNDAIVSGWSPDSAFITYTQVKMVLYQGTWYWDDAFIKGLRWYSPGGAHALLSPVSLDWDVHWVTTEAQAPISAVNPLPPQSSNGGG
jgi:TolB protein